MHARHRSPFSPNPHTLAVPAFLPSITFPTRVSLSLSLSLSLFSFSPLTADDADAFVPGGR